MAIKLFRMSVATASLAAIFATGAMADGAANFKSDVNAAIDAGLAYSRANNYFTTMNYGNGLSLLTLLEKESIPAGYSGLSASDKTLAQAAACMLMVDGNYGGRGGFYSYYDGQVLMALSVYLDTGGPDTPTGTGSYNCVGKSARATIDKVVDRTIAAQSAGVPAFGNCAGYWGYAGTGCDSSTTQLTIAGLASAKGFYAAKGESADKNRIPLITTSLNLTSDGYAANGSPQSGGLFNSCTATGCSGHGYQANYGFYYGSTYNVPQQTASGTWGQLVGARNVNDTSVQRYLRWLQNAYNPDTNPGTWYYGAQSYFYFLWSSSKAYNIIQQSGVVPTAGNIGPDAMGTLPALTSGGLSRIQNRNPATDVRPPPRGAGVAGYYGAPNAAQSGWYYDYAYRLMSLQTAAGQFPNPLSSWGYPQVDHAYAILVLQRSLGGACVDSDGDGVCDKDDNCPSVPNPNQNPDACQITCDVNLDGKVTQADLTLIRAKNGQLAGANDPYDPNKDGKINVADVRYCQLRLTPP
ncbi:MAG: hypothetical protein KF720_19815 [Rubrivivax sp.]|nr:hypothetical protein [Rubrivivax sp.]